MPSRAFQQASIISSDGALTGVTVTPSQISDQANTSTGYIDLPSGTTAQRPVSTTSGSVRYNTTLATVEVYNGTSWLPVGTVYDAESSSTGFFDLPSGTTAQRPATPSVGMMRYNSTTGFVEVYTSIGWSIVGQPPPTITNVTPVTFNGEQGTTFTINGINFTSDATVKFITNNSIEFLAATVTFIDSTQITATTSRDFTVAEEPLDIKVTQSSGSATLVDSIDCGGTPTWSTAAGTIATINDALGSYNPIATLSATDPDAGATISYSVSSGSLPAGTILNSSTGQISGDPDNVAGQTTSNFSIAATDNAGNSSIRAFSIIVNPTADGSTSTRAAVSGNAIKTLGLSSDYYWIAPPGQSAKYCYVDNTNYGGGWVLVQAVGSGTNYHWAQTVDYNLYNDGTKSYIPFSGANYSSSSGRRFSDAFIKAIGINGEGILRYEVARNGAQPVSNNPITSTTDYKYAVFVRYDNGFTWYNSSNSGGDADRVSKAVDISHAYPFNWETGGSGHFILLSSAYKVLDMHSDPSSIKTTGYDNYRILFGYTGTAGLGIYGGSSSFTGTAEGNPGYQWVR